LCVSKARGRLPRWTRLRLAVSPGRSGRGSQLVQRGGHIAGAINIPWAQAVREDGTFKSAEELKAVYASTGVTPDKEVIAYCQIGERSAHTWFVLKYLLGYPGVRNYDGSRTEWGSLIDVPIEK
jgi:thiosulfate/3-mercaptopyruvate sulfurtransferase